MGKLVMAYWDCPVCGAKGNRGDTVNCPSCGRARGDVKFYMQGYTEGETREENERGDIEYLDEEKAKYVSKNPDWYCSFCDSLNSDNAAFCSNCGATRADSESNYFDRLKKKQEREAAEAAARPQASRPAPKPKFNKWLLLIIAAVIGLIVYFFIPKTAKDLKVTGLSWARSITVEENRQYSESGWELPAGAELTDRKTEFHHTDQVLDHYESRQVQRSRRVLDHYETYYTYEDRGNGYFEEVAHERPVYETETYYETVQEPVYVPVPRYATKYYYNIWRWNPSREASASGTDHSPYWPDTNLGENEREGARSEAYGFTVENSKGESTAYRITPTDHSESDWMKLNIGSGIQITTGGGKLYVSDEQGNKIADIQKLSR